MSNPVILYNNIFNDKTLSATDTESGYDANNLSDWRTFTQWKAASAGTKYVTIDYGTAVACDCLGIHTHNLYTAGATVSIESSPDNSTWTTRLAGFTPASDKAVLKTFVSASARYWRIKIVTASVAPYMAIAALGAALQFNKGAYIGDGAINPHEIGIVAENSISKAGNILGNTIRYKPVTITLTIASDTYTWYSTYFWPFWRDHASELMPFFFALDLSTFGSDIFLVQITSESVFAAPMLFKDRVDRYTLSMKGILEV